MNSVLLRVGILHLCQLALLLYVAASAQFCCDAMYYLDAGARVFSEGLLYQDAYAGYRSYFVPMVFGVLGKIATSFGAQPSQAFPYIASVVYFLLTTIISMYVITKISWRRYFMFAVPLIFNPFMLAYVPYPLQESAILLMVVPLIFLLLASDDRRFHWTVMLLVLIAGLAYLTRSSLGWLVVPLLAYGAVQYRMQRNAIRVRPVLATLALSLLTLTAFFAPQSYISQKKFGTVAPYPSDHVASAQIAWGVEMYKYATIKEESEWRGARYLTSTSVRSLPERSLSFYSDHPRLALPIVLAHVWSGLHYDTIVPYVAAPPVSGATIPLMISALVVFFGVVGLFGNLKRAASNPNQAFVLMTFVMSCAYTAFVATEARFGLFGFAALSLAAVALFDGQDGRRMAWHFAPAAALYVAATCLINELLIGTVA